VYDDITGLIGNTPLIKLRKFNKKNDTTILAKLEWYNIGGSVKARMAKYLIDHAEKIGELQKNKVILEATSGNTGIALTLLAATKGYKITIVMPESASIERKKIIKAYGANLVFSSGDKGTSGAIELKQKMLKENPEVYVDIDQFRDPMNIQAHYDTTGREILEQTNGEIDVIVVGIGTAGTGVGISKRVKEYDPNIKVVGVTPQKGVTILGLRNPCDTYPSQLYDRKSFDDMVEIPKEEVPLIHETVRKLAREEGLLVGMSAGSVFYVAGKEAEKLGNGGKVVAVLADSGEKYLSTNLFND
jgi:cysteine synthase